MTSLVHRLRRRLPTVTSHCDRRSSYLSDSAPSSSSSFLSGHRPDESWTYSTHPGVQRQLAGEGALKRNNAGDVTPPPVPAVYHAPGPRSTAFSVQTSAQRMKEGQGNSEVGRNRWMERIPGRDGDEVRSISSSKDDTRRFLPRTSPPSSLSSLPTSSPYLPTSISLVQPPLQVPAAPSQLVAAAAHRTPGSLPQRRRLTPSTHLPRLFRNFRRS